MTLSTSLTGEGALKQFPEFSKLSMGDRDQYERFIDGMPPIADIQFYALMVHWNGTDVNTVSLLNGNLILSYWIVGADKLNGVSLIGTHDTDKTLCELFDTQRALGQSAKVVHVPEFVVESIEHPELFRFTSERYMDEYVIDLTRHADVQSLPMFIRHRIKRFEKWLLRTGNTAEVRPIDISQESERTKLIGLVRAWEHKSAMNNAVKHINENIHVALNYGPELGLSVLGLFVSGELKAFMVYHDFDGTEYSAMSHLLIDEDIPHLLSYMVFVFSKWFVSNGKVLMNIDSDLGIPLIRGIKIAHRPCNFFRKYTIRPA